MASSPQGCKEADMTERTHTHTHTELFGQLKRTDKFCWCSIYLHSVGICVNHSVVFNSATPWSVARQSPLSIDLQARIVEWVAISFSKLV